MRGGAALVANTMEAMNRVLSGTLALILGIAIGPLLAGCGSQTKTVSVADTPVTSTTTSVTSQTTSKTTTSTPAATTPVQTTTNGGTSAPGSTRTETAPAFTHQEKTSSEGTSGAAAVVREHGYTPNKTSEYHPTQTLSVLVGTRTGSGDGYGQQAFFFLGGKYIGTDAKEPSAMVKVVSQSDTAITLAYPLYRKSDPLSSPSGGEAKVTFELNDGKLTPSGPIPPASSSSGPSRN
jgi:LppP/LprE lipoprotein